MSYEDFCRCTPSEFSAVAVAWQKDRESSVRSNWEQARFLATKLLQPYSSKPIKPTDICVFEWDKITPPKQVEKSTRERMEAVRARLKQNQ